MTLAALLAIIPFAVPVIFAGYGEVIGQRSGVLNIGIEGIMLLGAYFGLAAGTSLLGTQASIVGICTAGGIGVLLGALCGFFYVYLSADQVVVGTAINLAALGVTSTLLRVQFGQLEKPTVHKLASFHGIDAGEILMLACLIGVEIVVRKTNWGLALRAAGEYPKAVQAAGFSVQKIRFTACLINGLFAGLAGAYLVYGVNGTFTENMTAGKGFLAIALVTFGRWNAGAVTLAALFVGYLETLQYSLQANHGSVPPQLLQALPYVAALLVLVVSGKSAKGPAYLTLPFRREE